MRAKFHIDPLPQSSQGDVSKPAQSIAPIAKKKQPVVLLKFPVKALGIAVLILVLLGVGYLVYPLLTKPESKQTISPVAPGPNTLTNTEVKAIVAKVEKHIALTPETPQVVAISNVESLKKQQPFFTAAQNGDQLLVYPTRVILYRPSSDQIIDIAQIRTTPMVSPQPTESYRVSPTPSASVHN